MTPCSLGEVRPYLGERCRGKTEDDVQRIGDGDHTVGFGAWTADGNDIVTNPFQGRPNIWNAATGGVDQGLLDQIPLRPGQNEFMTCLAISFSGHSVAEGDRSGSIVVVDERSKARSFLGPQPGFSPTQIYFNPANENEVVAIAQSKTILWQTGKSEGVTLAHNNASAAQAAFDPKGQFLVTGANDGTVRLWTLDPAAPTDPQHPIELRGHHGPVYAVDVGPDGTIVSGSVDGSLRFWRTDAPRVSEQDPESLKRLVANNLPYLDYGDKRLAASATACSIMGNCPSASEE